MFQRHVVRRLPSTTGRADPIEPWVLIVDTRSAYDASLLSILAGASIRAITVSRRPSELGTAVRQGPDLILLELSAPESDAALLVRWLHDASTAPIVAILPRARESERFTLLDAGASDYLVHPYASSDLLGRVRVWLRQSARAHPGRFQFESSAELRIDPERRVVLVDGREVHVTPIECKLLLTLAHHQRLGATEEQLLADVWGAASTSRVHHLRARLRQLRQKIEWDPTRPRHLVVEHGRYRLKVN
jgi:two-component system KDP operon response regulator KdpE